MTFKDAVNNQYTTTTNGMLAHAQTGNALTNLFYKIGSARNTNIIPDFIAAYIENPELAIRIALWARDARGGAGERATFYSILNYLNDNDRSHLSKILDITPEIGRWDDLLQVDYPHSFTLIKRGLDQGNRLCAKWMPRKGPIASKLRKFLGLTPKSYRKLLVSLSNTVEQKMCSNNWNSINYSHVPGKAMLNYKAAFSRRDEVRFSEFLSQVKKGVTSVKSDTLYPYEIVHQIRKGNELDLLKAQWEALPNYIKNKSILPLIDVSGSMNVKNNPKSSVTNMDIAVSLGLYLADKNKGPFKDVFVTFSTSPQLVELKGDIVQKIDQMVRSSWGMSTNIMAAMELILKTAVENKVPQSEMPDTLVILSDMQFNGSVIYNATAKDMIQRGFKHWGYEAPKMVFWNLNASYSNTPARVNDLGVALISGFSPSILKSFLEGKDITPYSIMMETIMKDRYNIFNNDTLQ